MVLNINGNDYEVHFGIGFVRKLDEKYFVTNQSGVKFGTGLETKIPMLLANDTVTLSEFLYEGTCTEKKRPTQKDVDMYIDQAEDIGTSFQNLNTAVVRGMEKVIRSADNSLTEAGLPNFQQQLETTKTGVNAAFTVASEAVGKFVKIAAPGVKLVTNNLDVLIPVLGTATGGFVAYKAAIAIDDKVKKLSNAWKEAKERLRAMRNVIDLQTAAVKSQEAATIAATRAHELSTKASIAQEEAEKAQAAAKALTTKATKAQEAAEKAQTKASMASSASTELSAERVNLSIICASTETPHMIVRKITARTKGTCLRKS
ncbi:tail assembly chaperone [Eubacterium sp.]|uniref:tail assembly chaperone n=1 Tax=Eubacterium sp. TaxID=142586 RepID=UPI003AB2F38B